MLSKFADSQRDNSQPPKKKVLLHKYVHEPSPGSTIQICVKNEAGELMEIQGSYNLTLLPIILMHEVIINYVFQNVHHQLPNKSALPAFLGEHHLLLLQK